MDRARASRRRGFFVDARLVTASVTRDVSRARSPFPPHTHPRAPARSPQAARNKLNSYSRPVAGGETWARFLARTNQTASLALLLDRLERRDDGRVATDDEHLRSQVDQCRPDLLKFVRRRGRRGASRDGVAFRFVRRFLELELRERRSRPPRARAPPAGLAAPTRPPPSRRPMSTSTTTSSTRRSRASSTRRGCPSGARSSRACGRNSTRARTGFTRGTRRGTAACSIARAG